MNNDLLKKMREGGELSRREKLALVLRLSVPAVLSQLSTIIMEYIDASMVGSLGPDASAAIGLVSTTTWLIGGLSGAVGIGFTVGIAHSIGAGDNRQARKNVRSGLVTVLVFSVVMMLLVAVIHRALPRWMGGEAEILRDASAYFLIFGLMLPLLQINYTGAGMLECSGNMKVPGLINMIMCGLDVVFNFFCIYPSRYLTFFGKRFYMPGLGLGVKGAALGTLMAEACGATAILLAVLVFSEKLHMRKGERGGLGKKKWLDTVRVSLPAMGGSLVMGFAYVMATRIVAPLGKIAISANSFAITAESLCYMPGYGISRAATTLVGQTRGAGRIKLEKSFHNLTVMVGIMAMTGASVLMYIFAPEMIGIMTPDPDIRTLGTAVLRIVAFAEPFFGAAIVSEGVFRGMGRTMTPGVLNMISMWLIRLPASVWAARVGGLEAVWLVMSAELAFRGILFSAVLHNAGRKLSC